MSRALSRTMHYVNNEKLFTFSNLVVMVLTFLVFGLFILLEVFSQTLLDKLEKEVAVTVFFKDEYDEKKILDLKSKIEMDERVYSVKYVSKEDAFAIFKELNKDEPLLLESVTANVLPASLEIRAHDVSKLGELSEEYSKMEGVEGVKYFKDIIERFNKWRVGLSLGVGALLAILLLVSFSIVISTIRTAISVRGPEYEILKLVGASDGFIKEPLVYQGIFYGGVSAFIAWVIYAVALLGAQFGGVFESINLSQFVLYSNFAVTVWGLILLVFLILTVSGVVLGFLSSYSAVRKYLKY